MQDMYRSFATENIYLRDLVDCYWMEMKFICSSLHTLSFFLTVSQLREHWEDTSQKVNFVSCRFSIHSYILYSY